MIADSQAQNENTNANATLDSQPPAYEMLSGGASSSSTRLLNHISQLIFLHLTVLNAENYPKDIKHPLPPQQQPQATAMPDIHGTPLIDVPTMTTSSTTGVTVYHYVHPVTQQRITSLLPPDHPEMVCLQKGHDRHSTFGLMGILAAVLWFPLGMACLFVDRKVRCTR